MRLHTGGQADVWIKQLDRGPLSRLTFGSSTTPGDPDTRPEWTADGRAVTYISDRTGRQALWQQPADGGAEPRLLHESERNIAEGFASLDAGWLVYRTNLQDPGRADILAIRPGVDSAPRPLVATEAEEITPALSPDGRWLAYVSNESGRSEVYVRPFPHAAAAQWQVSTSEGEEPVWARSGRELFYRNGAGNLVAVGIQTTPGFSVRDERVLFSMAPYRTEDSHRQYAVFPGDNSFLMIRPLVSAAEGDLIVVENWFEELKRRVGR
jgi:serine/threonine-protein kinase